MTTNLEPQVTVRFSPKVFAGLQAYAGRHNMELCDVVETMVRQRIIDDTTDLIGDENRKQIQAEAELMAFVEETVAGYKQAGNWDEHVTKRVFEAIRDQKIEAYKRAVGCDPFTFGHHEKARINKRIGARTKRLLGADVKMIDNERQKGQPSRTEESLILSYTLLVERSH